MAMDHDEVWRKIWAYYRNGNTHLGHWLLVRWLNAELCCRPYGAERC